MLKNKMFNVLFVTTTLVAVVSALHTASVFWTHEPKMPKKLMQ